MEAFRHAHEQADAAAHAGAVLHRDDGVLGFEATFALFSEARFGYTAASIGFLFAFIGVVLALIQGVLVGKVVKRVGERAVDSAGDLLRSRSASAWCRSCGTCRRCSSRSACWPSAWASTARRCRRWCRGCRTRTIRAASLGLASSLASLGRVVGPAWGGYLYDAYGMTTPYLSAAALMMMRSCGGVSFDRDSRPQMSRASFTPANPGPFTGDGNWTYLIPGDRPVLIDAGVGTPSHLDAIAAAAAHAGSAPVGDARAQRSHRGRAGDPRALAVGAAVEDPWPIRDRDLPWPPLADGDDRSTTGEGALQVAPHAGARARSHCLWHADRARCSSATCCSRAPPC